MSGLYKNAGVNINAGYEAVSVIKEYAQKTHINGVLGGLGGFGGMFDLTALNVKEPVLVSGADGVGTKIMLAFKMDIHETIGIDAVAMCVNDIIVQGAKPLFFLDYIASGKCNVKKIEKIIHGISKGCKIAGCALIGGETAEMPGMYNNNEYDLAGFTVGVVEKQSIITGKNIKKGDILLGLSSSGVHSNGYSLIRKIIEDNKLSLYKTYEELSMPLGEVLLTPTRIYVQSILSLLKNKKVSGMAHITGGGFIENIPRMMPKGLGANIEKKSWYIPPIFKVLQKIGNIKEEEMYNIFNMGIGMVIALDETLVDDAINLLKKEGEQPFIIGHVGELEGVNFI